MGLCFQVWAVSSRSGLSVNHRPNGGLAGPRVLAIQRGRPQAFKHAERWQSGRSRRTRNAKYGQLYRGFESLPLRHLPEIQLYSLKRPFGVGPCWLVRRTPLISISCRSCWYVGFGPRRDAVEPLMPSDADQFVWLDGSVEHEGANRHCRATPSGNQRRPAQGPENSVIPVYRLFPTGANLTLRDFRLRRLALSSNSHDRMGQARRHDR